MSAFSRFEIDMAVSAIVFVALLLFVTRKRERKPNATMLILTTFVVVVLGMVFARYGHLLYRPPWWIYYGVPTLVTLLLPPALLRMKLNEILQYVPLAALMGPAIHAFFPLFLGWHDYMPFPFYIPSILELAHHIR